MSNVPGPQPDVAYCPVCKGRLRNVPRAEMVSSGHVRADGTISDDTHTYQCVEGGCAQRFEINQDR